MRTAEGLPGCSTHGAYSLSQYDTHSSYRGHCRRLSRHLHDDGDRRSRLDVGKVAAGNGTRLDSGASQPVDEEKKTLQAESGCSAILFNTASCAIDQKDLRTSLVVYFYRLNKAYDVLKEASKWKLMSTQTRQPFLVCLTLSQIERIGQLWWLRTCNETVMKSAPLGLAGGRGWSLATEPLPVDGDRITALIHYERQRCKKINFFAKKPLPRSLFQHVQTLSMPSFIDFHTRMHTQHQA